MVSFTGNELVLLPRTHESGVAGSPRGAFRESVHEPTRKSILFSGSQ
jgi:hypothetical protein